MSDAANRFIFRAIWPKSPAEGKTHTFVERLSELRERREDLLTEDEYQALRSEILQELVTRARMPKLMLLFFVLMTFGFSAWAIWSLVTNGVTGIGGLLLPLILVLVFWYRQARDYASKRRLSVPQRLLILEELVSAGLLSPDKAAGLRGQIESLPPLISRIEPR